MIFPVENYAQTPTPIGVLYCPKAMPLLRSFLTP
jgi:hypothetical protein